LGIAFGWILMTKLPVCQCPYEFGYRHSGYSECGVALLAPFAGINFHFWRSLPGFLGSLSVTLKAAYSVTGRFSGVDGTAGLTYRLK